MEMATKNNACNYCKKLYKDRSGLFRHFKKHKLHQTSRESSNETLENLYEQINATKKDFNLLKIKYVELQEENNILKVRLNEMQKKISDSHQMIYDLPLCNSKTLTFDQAWKKRIKNFSPPTQNYWTNTMKKYMNDNENISEENANSYIALLIGNPSSIIMIKKIIQASLRIYFSDPGLALANVNLFINPKKKYIFIPENLNNFLEYMRWTADLSKKSKHYEYFMICFMLAKYGMRANEIIKIKVNMLYPTEIITSETKNKNKAKTFMISEILICFLNKLAENKTQNEYVFNEIRSTCATIRRIMQQSPILKHVNIKKWAVGLHCLRVSLYDRTFIDAFTKAQNKTKNVSQHKSQSSLSHYVSYQHVNNTIDNCIDNIHLIGTSVLQGFFKLDDDISDKIFDISCNYKQFWRIKDDICSGCYLLITDEMMNNCNVCNDKYHIKCHTNNKITCYDCDYVSDEGYMVRPFLKKIIHKCSICGKIGKIICEVCIEIELSKLSCDACPIDRCRLQFSNVIYDKKIIDFCDGTLKDALLKENVVYLCEPNYLNSNKKFRATNLHEIRNDIEAKIKINNSPVFVDLVNEKHVARALADIPINTIICEYVGDVYKFRNAPFGLILKDSLVINCNSSHKNTLIYSGRGSNMTKFILKSKNEEECNVFLRKYKSDLRTLIIVISKRKIYSKEILYMSCDM